MRELETVSGEIDTSSLTRSGPRNAPRLPLVRVDATELTRPRSWPRATRDLTHEIPRKQNDQLRDTIWFALGGLLIALGLYLVF